VLGWGDGGVALTIHGLEAHATFKLQLDAFFNHPYLQF
jgi:hypothetical protein